MTQEAIYLIDLLEDQDKKKIKNWFDKFDSRSTDINDWQTYLGFELEPYGCDICHRIRNKIMSAISHYFGVKHLDDKIYNSLGILYFKEAVNLIKQAEPIRIKIKDVYPQIKQFLYN